MYAEMHLFRTEPVFCIEVLRVNENGLMRIIRLFYRTTTLNAVPGVASNYNHRNRLSA